MLAERGLVRANLADSAPIMLQRLLDSARARTETVRRWLLTPRLVPERGLSLVRLGTAYGGWDFVDRPELVGATIISAGLGEDASFDVEFAAKYGAKVIIADPTPRAVQHFREMVSRIGMPAAEPYANSGQQAPESYDLSAVSPGQLTLVERAIWTKDATLSFYAPTNPDHVSHSISDYQHYNARNGDRITVMATTINAIMRERGISALPLLKLDIEGAEIDVLRDIDTWNVLPAQILVEFDEIGFKATTRARRRMLDAHTKLCSLGYAVSSWDDRCNASYLLSR